METPKLFPTKSEKDLLMQFRPKGIIPCEPGARDIAKTVVNRFRRFHARQEIPVPYPTYPALIIRSIDPEEFIKIDAQFGVSKVLPRKKFNVFARLVNVLCCFCYDKAIHNEMLELTVNIRHARGGLIRNPKTKAMPVPTLDTNIVDQILENALQRRDFHAIRVALNYEGYDIPVDEPNNLLSPSEAANKEVLRAKDIEIQITPEEYEMWEAPLEECEPEPVVNESLHNAFVEVMAQNIPYRLERLIRRRDVKGLRMWLRLYGHDILPNQRGDQDHLLESDITKASSDEPEPHQ